MVLKPASEAITLTGAYLQLLDRTWDPSTGIYTAKFALPLLGGTVTYTVTATDEAGNVGQSSATTLLR